MALHDESKVLGLAEAKDDVLRWDSDTPFQALDSSIEVILNASRDPATRKECQQPELLKAFLRLYHSTYDGNDSNRQIETKLLRCIGNLVSDNDSYRDMVVESPDFLSRLSRSIRDVTGDLERADTAVKVLYNVCNTHPAAQQAALRLSLHISLLYYIDQHPWNNEDALLALATDVLSDIVQQKQIAELEEEFDRNWTSLLLKLPCLDELEPENFLDAANITIPYLADVKFQEVVLSNQQLPLAFGLLETTTFITPQLDDEAGLEYEKRIIHFLADVSSLPAYSSTYTVDDDFVKTLCDRCILTENKTDSPSIAICACILLANLCISDEVAVELPAMIKMENLCDYICLQAYGRSRADDSAQSHQDYLHAAAGLLRHLAMPLSNRQSYFGSEQCRQAAMALVQYPQSDIQCAGLRLYRQILNDEPERLERFVASSYLTACLKVYIETDSSSVKIEVARLQLAHFRTLTRIVSQQPDSPLVSTILDTEHILEALSFAATQNAVPLAQAEGWLGLCLVARLPGGPPRVSQLFAQEALLDALRQEVKGHATDKNDNAVTEQDDATIFTGRRNSVPDWLKEKERHNAVVLVHELLKSAEVVAPLRGNLESVLHDSGIKIV